MSPPGTTKQMIGAAYSIATVSDVNTIRAAYNSIATISDLTVPGSDARRSDERGRGGSEVHSLATLPATDAQQYAPRRDGETLKMRHA